MSKYGVFSGPYFSVFGQNTEIYSPFSPNTGKYKPEKTPYLDTFDVVSCCPNISTLSLSFDANLAKLGPSLEKFFSKCVQIWLYLQIRWDLLQTSLIKNLIEKFIFLLSVECCYGTKNCWKSHCDTNFVF